jgi:hypothetical protein
MYPTTNLLKGVAWVSIKNERTREINYGKCIAASRTDRITPGTHWRGRSNVKNGVYPTSQLLNGVAQISINNEGNREIIYGNSIAASRPDRTTTGAHSIGRLNDKNGVYPTTQLLHGVARVSINMKELEKLIMEIVSQLHAPTALPPELIV